MLYRTTVFPGDPHRDWTVVWDRGNARDPASYGFFMHGEDIWAAPRLVDSSGQAYNVREKVIREQNGFEACFYRVFQVSHSVPFGEYRLMIGARQFGIIRVAMRPARLSSILSGRISSFKMSAGSHYYGHNATVVGGSVAVAPNCTVEGLTVYDSMVEGVATNTTFKDCRFVGCQFGGMVDWSKGSEYADHEALYERCVFDTTHVTGCCSGCFLGCRFQNRCPERNRHNFVNERSHRLCMFNCTFDTTDRGLVLRTAWGDNSGGLYVGMNFRHINQTTNGNEVLCVENNLHRFDNNIFLGWNVYDCANHIQIWNTPARYNLFGYITTGKGCTINFSGIEEQTDNQVRHCKLSAPVMNSGRASNNLVEDVSIV